MAAPQGLPRGHWQRYLAEGGTIDAYESPPVEAWEVDIERDRRITGGFDFGGHRYQSGDFDQRNIADAAQAASTAILDGSAKPGDLYWLGGTPAAAFYFITASNERVPMDAFQMRGLGQTMVRWKQHHIEVARQLKDMDPIPVAYQDDLYWIFNWTPMEAAPQP